MILNGLYPSDDHLHVQRHYTMRPIRCVADVLFNVSISVEWSPGQLTHLRGMPQVKRQ